MVSGAFRSGVASVAVAALLLAAAPAAAVSKTAPKRGGGQTSSLRGGVGVFTPAASDPRAAALFAHSGLGNGFRFTPATSPGGRRAVTVAVRATRSLGSRPAVIQGQAQRTAIAAAEAATPLTPTAYSLGAAIGWKRFAFSGDVARFDTGGLPGGRELVDVGLSYQARKFSTRLQLGTDRSAGNGATVLGLENSYSVDLAGSYALSRNLELTGGVRYKTQRDRLEQLNDNRRDSQAVYIGTAFKF